MAERLSRHRDLLKDLLNHFRYREPFNFKFRAQNDAVFEDGPGHELDVVGRGEAHTRRLLLNAETVEVSENYSPAKGTLTARTRRRRWPDGGVQIGRARAHRRYARGPLPVGSGLAVLAGSRSAGWGTMDVVLVVRLLIPGVRLRDGPAGTEFGLERFTGLIIPAISARSRRMFFATNRTGSCVLILVPPVARRPTY